MIQRYHFIDSYSRVALLHPLTKKLLTKLTKLNYKVWKKNISTRNIKTFVQIFGAANFDCFEFHEIIRIIFGKNQPANCCLDSHDLLL